jgi:regulator of protease activity HflC (stomatin/prohibitin superfamily)
VILAIVLVLVFILAGGVVIAGASVRVLREYERAVVFRLGRVTSQRGPGLIYLTPFVDRMVRVSLRTVTLEIPAQEIITRDNVPARVTAVAYYRVIDPNKAVIEIENVLAATSQVAQTTLRSVLGKAELDALLSEREKLNEHLQHIIDDQTEPWGVKVTAVEIKDVEIPERMQHAMARQAEAERERRAKIINAEGEFQAAARLNDAADVISRNPVTIQLRNLQTLIEVSNNQSSTIVFPLPMDVLAPLLSAAQGRNGSTGAAVDPAERERLDEVLGAAREALEAATGGAGEAGASSGALPAAQAPEALTADLAPAVAAEDMVPPSRS